jgi:hypothetical protein
MGRDGFSTFVDNFSTKNSPILPALPCFFPIFAENLKDKL